MKCSKRKRYGVINNVSLDRAIAGVQETREGQKNSRIKRYRKKAVNKIVYKQRPCPAAALPVIPFPDTTPPQPNPRKPKRTSLRKYKNYR